MHLTYQSLTFAWGYRFGSTTSRTKKQRVEGKTRAGRDRHFEQLKEFFVKNHAMSSDGKWLPQRKKYIINFDECPSPLDGGKSSGAAKHAFHQRGALVLACALHGRVA